MIIDPFLCPKYFSNRFSCTNTKLNQVTIQFYAKIVARLLLKLGWDILPHICRIAAANPKWLPLCRGNWKVRQNDQYSTITYHTWIRICSTRFKIRFFGSSNFFATLGKHIYFIIKKITKCLFFIKNPEGTFARVNLVTKHLAS